MRIVLATAFCFFLSVNSFAVGPHAEDDGISRPKESSEEGIKRRVAPTSTETGLNGKLIWWKEYLFLQTPSGKKVRLTAANKDLESKLVEASEGANHVELFGEISEGKMKVKEVESAVTSKAPLHAEYGLLLKGTPSLQTKRQMQAALNEIDGVKVGYLFERIPRIVLSSELSQKTLEEKIQSIPILKNNVAEVTKEIVKDGDNRPD